MNIEAIRKVYLTPFVKLVEEAHHIHALNFPQHEVQASQLLSIKTGGCPEDCSYCPQSARYNTGVKKEPLMSVDEIKGFAKKAKQSGATRFCMGAAWRQVRDGKEFDQVLESVKEVKSAGLEVCCTLGMLSLDQAKKLKNAGLYAYNHNIDTSKENYSEIISTRSFEDRIKTIENVRKAGITVCTGGILGLGESDEDRVSFLWQLASFTPVPESITINTLVRTPGTPLADNHELDPTVLIRVIATARVIMPQSMIRLSAGRSQRSTLEQFLCFYVGANSIFFGEKLLTSPNPSRAKDKKMLRELGFKIKSAHA